MSLGNKMHWGTRATLQRKFRSDIPELLAQGDNDRALIASEGSRVTGKWLITRPGVDLA